MSNKKTKRVYNGIPFFYPNIQEDNIIAYLDFKQGLKGKGIKKVHDLRKGNTTSFSNKEGITGRSGVFTKSTTGATYSHILQLDKSYDVSNGISFSYILKMEDVTEYFNGLYLTNVLDFNANITGSNLQTTYRILGVNPYTSTHDLLSLGHYINGSTACTDDWVPPLHIPKGRYVFVQTIIKDMISYHYINGVLVDTKNLQSVNMGVTTFNSIRLLFPTTSEARVEISELLVTTNTEVVPNPIPEDYINGDADLKPCFGQQQIKADAMTAQRTFLKIPSALSNYKTDELDADGTSPCLGSPELRTGRSNTWAETTSKIKIKGMNNEVLTGVVDSNTALAKIVKTTRGSNKIYVDSVAKFEVGDTFSYVYDGFTSVSTNPNYKVTAIDTTENVLTVSASTNWYAEDILCENTSSSSVPTLITEDGKTVNGTWSGLGTNEIMFTMGSNTGISGKNLYVAYGLVIPDNNSHFSKMPLGDIRAYTENDTELYETSTINIKDDFKGKIVGSTTVCPHNAYEITGTKVYLPTEVDYRQEFLEGNYRLLGNMDGRCATTTKSNSTGQTHQQIFSISLIDIVERKFGAEIPSRDKVQWLKDNIQKVEIYYRGYSPNAKLHVRCYNSKTSAWVGTTTTTNTSLGYAITYLIDLSTMLHTNGRVYLTAYALDSDGQNAGVYTDHVSVNVTMNTNSKYKYLYCKNTGAREDECNPVLIQPNTKGLTRYIPSNKPFVVDYEYNNYKPVEVNLNALSINNVLYAPDFIYATTQGTGAYNTVSNDLYSNCISYLNMEHIQSYKYHNNLLSTTKNGYVNTKFIQVPSVAYPDSPFDVMPLHKLDEGNVLTLKPILYKEDTGVLSLIICVAEFRGTGVYETPRYFKYPLDMKYITKL